MLVASLFLIGKNEEMKNKTYLYDIVLSIAVNGQCIHILI